MPENSRASKAELPPIPAKRYFTIGEVSNLCAVKPHVLRYWEQEFAQLKPVKRRGNRRYYQHHEVLLIRRIRDLLYQQGFTINGARHRLESEIGSPDAATPPIRVVPPSLAAASGAGAPLPRVTRDGELSPAEIRHELERIRRLLGQER